MPTPDASVYISTHCPNCAAVLTALTEMVKAGSLGELKVVNVDQRLEAARALGVRSVPWVRIGPFELTGLRSRQELEAWAARVESPEGMADWFHTLLKEGELARVLEEVKQQPERLAAVLPIVANPEASLNVRLGAGAVLESFAGQPPLKALLPRLAELTAATDARVRADACYYLGLTGDAVARPYLEACLHDADAQVREIAAEGLQSLASAE